TRTPRVASRGRGQPTRRRHPRPPSGWCPAPGSPPDRGRGPTVSEPDFRGLRADVEAATTLPEFTTIERRARWRRLRDRGAVVSAVLTTFAVLAPAAMAALSAHSHPLLRRPDQPVVDGSTQASPAASLPAPLARVRAVAGTDLDH